MNQKTTLKDFDRHSGKTRSEDELSEKERIDRIREYAEENDDEIIKKALESIFGNNKYKPKREYYWENHLNRGKNLMKRIREKEGS